MYGPKQVYNYRGCSCVCQLDYVEMPSNKGFEKRELENKVQFQRKSTKDCAIHSFRIQIKKKVRTRRGVNVSWNFEKRGCQVVSVLAFVITFQ